MSPTALRVLFSRVVDVFLRRSRDQRFSEEIQTHLDHLADGFVRDGMSPADARLAARRSFGGVDQVTSIYRDQRGLPSVNAWVNDLRFAVRLLVKDRWFTCAAVIALALGIGVTTTVFTILSGMNLTELPVERPDQIMHLDTADQAGRRRQAVSYADFLDWQRSSRTFSGLAAYTGGQTMNVGDEGRPAERFQGTLISANGFGLLGEGPILGRGFRTEDDEPGAAPVVILAQTVWMDRYGGDPSLIGRSIRINGLATTVIGVMPEGFRFPVLSDLWQPLALVPGLTTQKRDARGLGVFGRLADNATLGQARAELATIAAGLSAQYPETNRDVVATVLPFRERYMGSLTAGEPMIMMIAVGFVLLIACVNAANLLLARSAHRTREIALRAALGASRGRIIRQLLVESVVLAALAGVCGLGLAVGGMRAFTTEAGDLGLPYWVHFSFDARVFGFLAVICLGTALLFGLAPAWHLSKTTAHDVLKEGGRGGAGSLRTRRWTSTLVVAELALTIVLLAGAGLLIRSALVLYQADGIIDSAAVMTARLSLPAAKFRTPEQRASFYRNLDDRLQGIGSIASAAIATTLPFIGATPRQLVLDTDAVAPMPARMVNTVAITDRYFHTLGLAMLRGRPFEGSDSAAGQHSVIVNERFVALYSANAEPIGKRVRLGDAAAEGNALPWFTIVGVSPSLRHGPMSDITPMAYLPFRGTPVASAAIMVRGQPDRATVGAQLREVVRALDPDVALYNIMPLERLSQLSRWAPRVIGTLLALVAGIALFLSAMGLYAVTAYGVAQRTAEIGIRMALGAQRSQVLWLFLQGTLAQLAVGMIIGIAGAIAVGQLLRGVLVRTSPLDPLTFVVIVLALIGVAVVACLLPARRATRLDPVTALRHE